LNLGFKTKAKAFYVDIDTPTYTLDEAVNVILSPSLYWVKRINLPIKYLRDVKSLLPSLFEDILPEGKYSYSAYKEEDAFLLFAYNDKEILDLLAKKGINATNLNNVYLAQSEFDTIQAPVKVTDDSVLVLQNNVVVKLPLSLFPDADTLELSEHTYSKQAIHLTRFNQIADKKSQVVFGSILGFLIIMFTTEWLITASKTTAIIEKQAEVFEHYHLQATSFQNEAVHAKLNNIFERQTRIRDILNLALTIKLGTDERVEEIALEKNKIVIVIKTASEQTGSQRLAKLKKRFKRTTSRFDNGSYVMEVRL